MEPAPEQRVIFVPATLDEVVDNYSPCTDLRTPRMGRQLPVSGSVQRTAASMHNSTVTRQTACQFDKQRPHCTGTVRSTFSTDVEDAVTRGQLRSVRNTEGVLENKLMHDRTRSRLVCMKLASMNA